MRTTCINCGKKIGKHSKYCQKCYLENHNCNYKGKNNPNYKHGGYVSSNIFNCIDCGKIISRYDAIRCKGCTNTFLRSGENSPLYIDGRTPLIHKMRYLDEYKQWRSKVFERDDYRCQECFTKGCYLEVHHIKSFLKIFQEFLNTYSQFSPIEDKETLLRLSTTYAPFWDIDNGETICKDCHKKTDNFLSKARWEAK